MKSCIYFYAWIIYPFPQLRQLSKNDEMWCQAYALEGHMWVIFSCRHLNFFFNNLPFGLVLKAQTALLDIKWVALLSWILLVSHPGVWALTEENISWQTTHYCCISLIRTFLRGRPWISDLVKAVILSLHYERRLTDLRHLLSPIAFIYFLCGCRGSHLKAFYFVASLLENWSLKKGGKNTQL